MDLTLCIIVKNEGKNLYNCLSSFSGLYQKLVVVDTGSTDHTKDIAKDFGGKIFDFNWEDNFSKARNYALSKVNTPLVMMVDADDFIGQSDVVKLKKEIKKMTNNVYGIFLPYIYSAVKGKNGNLSYIPRIWRTDNGYKYELPVHEYLNIPKKDIGKFKRISIPIIHNKNTSDFHKGYKRNIRILMKEYKKNPDQRRIIYYLGHDNQQVRNYEQAISWYKKYQILKDIHKDEEHKTYVGIGICYLKLKNIEEAKKAFRKAILINPMFVEPYVFLGDIAMKEKKYEEAVEIYFKALNCNPPITHVFTNTNLYNSFIKGKMTEALNKIENQIKHDASI